MTISEAIETDYQSRGVRRKAWANQQLYILPTDSEKCCWLKPLDQRWTPLKDDLLAEDWEVYQGDAKHEKYQYPKT